MSVYTKKQIAEIINLTQRQVQFYTEQGVVTPEIDAGEGRGKIRIYSHYNVVQFTIIKGLTDLGMTISKIRPILKHLDDHYRRQMRNYEVHKTGVDVTQQYINIFLRNDGKIEVGWALNSDDSDTFSILKHGKMKDFDECIVINLGRRAGAVESKK